MIKKMPLIAKLHVSKFKRKGYKKVTTISLKKLYFIENIILNKVTRSNYMFSRKFEKAKGGDQREKKPR